MNVTHIIPSVTQAAAGPSYSVPRLCSALAKKNVVVTLCSVAPAPARIFEGHHVFPPSNLFLPKLCSSVELKRWLRKTALSGETQIMQNHSLWLMPNVYPAWAVSGTQVKLVNSPRGTLSRAALTYSRWRKALFWSFFQRKSLLLGHAFHATSEDEYLDIRRLGFKQPVFVLSNGVDVVPEARSVRTGRKTLLYLGRIHEKKGLPNLIRAWARVENLFPDWDLKIIGPESSHSRDLKSKSELLQLKRVSFEGPLFGEKKNAAYQSANIFVFPTLSENFGMTVAESLANGTPVITTKGAPWEVLRRHGCGWWIDIGESALESCLKEALSTPESVLESMGRLGRSLMEREFSWDSLSEKYVAAYSWLISGGSRPSFMLID